MCIGQAASIAAVLLAAGTKGKRFSLPNSRILIHQPWLSGLGGQATDIDMAAKEILRMRERINEILVHHTGQDVQRIQTDTERDYIMSAEQGKELRHHRRRHSQACLSPPCMPRSAPKAGRAGVEGRRG